MGNEPSSSSATAAGSSSSDSAAPHHPRRARPLPSTFLESVSPEKAPGGIRPPKPPPPLPFASADGDDDDAYDDSDDSGDEKVESEEKDLPAEEVFHPRGMHHARYEGALDITSERARIRKEAYKAQNQNTYSFGEGADPSSGGQGHGYRHSPKHHTGGESHHKDLPGSERVVTYYPDTDDDDDDDDEEGSDSDEAAYKKAAAKGFPDGPLTVLMWGSSHLGEVPDDEHHERDRLRETSLILVVPEKNAGLDALASQDLRRMPGGGAVVYLMETMVRVVSLDVQVSKLEEKSEVNQLFYYVRDSYAHVDLLISDNSAVIPDGFGRPEVTEPHRLHEVGRAPTHEETFNNIFRYWLDGVVNEASVEKYRKAKEKERAAKEEALRRKEWEEEQHQGQQHHHHHHHHHTHHPSKQGEEEGAAVAKKSTGHHGKHLMNLALGDEE